MRRFLAGVLASVALLGACGGGDDDAAETADPPRETDAPTTTTTRPERYETEIRQETYVDASRPTKANGEFAGAPDRTLRVVFHVPQGDGPFPVVLFSHGWIATPEIYAPIATQIAEAGYLVVAPAYPLSNGAAPGGPIVGDVLNQPVDASFVLDQVLAASGDEASWLHGLADAEHVAAGGHSLGGFTTMGFFNSCCTDDRIDAAFAVAGNMPGYEGTPYEGIDTPILLIHGDQDELVPYARSEAIYADANPPKYFLTLLGGKHAPFATEPAGEQVQIGVAVMLDFLDGYLRGNETALTDMTEIGNVEGVSTFVEETT